MDLKKYFEETILETLPEPCIVDGMIGAKCRLGAMHPSYTEIYWRIVNQTNPGLGRRGPDGYLGQEARVSLISSRGARMPLQDNYSFCIFGLDSKLPIGSVGIHRTKTEINFTWSSGSLIGKSWQGQGIGTDAKMMMLRWISENFSAKEIPELFSTVLTFNQASLKVQKKCGYEIVENDNNDTFTRNGIEYKEVLLKVKPGQTWLRKFWNPYAKENNLEIWNPGKLD